MYDRQLQIPGWSQGKLEQATVAVVGDGFVPAPVVASLLRLGIGKVTLVAKLSLLGTAMIERLTDVARHFSIYPMSPSYEAELGFALDGLSYDVLICASNDLQLHALSANYAAARKLQFLAGAPSGPWFGQAVPPAEACTNNEDVGNALAIASLLVDSTRELLNPLSPGGLLPPDGFLPGLNGSQELEGNVVLVGAGGVGAFAAFCSAAAGLGLTIVDHDCVEFTNLPRQWLYTTGHATNGAAKALALADAIHDLFPSTRVEGVPARFDVDVWRSRVAKDNLRLIISAVDNARTRLEIQEFGRNMRLPVVQAGTDVFAADVFVQAAGTGPSLDEQLQGTMSEAEKREVAQQKSGVCGTAPSFVAPGLMAGAYATSRIGLVMENNSFLPPIRWRSGRLPFEEQRGC